MRKVLVEEKIALKIKRRIWNGEYTVGSLMPGQRELVTEFGSSPVTISKALRMVRNSGLIELAPKRGTRVLPVNERPLKGSVAVIHHGEDEPSRAEAVLILKGVYGALRDHSLHHVITSSGTFNSSEKIGKLHDFAGIILIEAARGEMIQLVDYCRDNRIPYVVANLEGQMKCACTWVDHGKTTETAVKTLAAFGHRRILFLTRDFDTFFYKSALDGYKRSLNELQIPFDENLVLMVNSQFPADFSNAVKEFFSLEENKNVSAVIACRDYQAHGAWKACEKLNLEVGRDISIIGFDNISWKQKNPRLTTFNEPAERLGTVAVEIILRQMSYGVQDSLSREIEAPLLLRSSVGPCLVNTAPSIPLELFAGPLETPY